jgi:hypothetical protein
MTTKEMTLPEVITELYAHGNQFSFRYGWRKRQAEESRAARRNKMQLSLEEAKELAEKCEQERTGATGEKQ